MTSKGEPGRGNVEVEADKVLPEVGADREVPEVGGNEEVPEVEANGEGPEVEAELRPDAPATTVLSPVVMTSSMRYAMSSKTGKGLSFHAKAAVCFYNRVSKYQD
jgi:hypothetical protein